MKKIKSLLIKIAAHVLVWLAIIGFIVVLLGIIIGISILIVNAIKGM